MFTELTLGQPGDVQHVVELSGRRGADGVWIRGKVKVQDEHDDQAVLVLHRDDVDQALETHAYGRNHGERRETSVLDQSVSSCVTRPTGDTTARCVWDFILEIDNFTIVEQIL